MPHRGPFGRLDRMAGRGLGCDHPLPARRPRCRPAPTLGALVPATIRPAVRGLCPWHPCAGRAEWVFTSAACGITPEGEIPEEARAQADLCFAACTAILARRGGSARAIRFGSTPFRHRPARTWALHGRPRAWWRPVSARMPGLHPGDRRGLHPPGVQGRGRTDRRPPARGVSDDFEVDGPGHLSYLRDGLAE